MAWLSSRCFLPETAVMRDRDDLAAFRDITLKQTCVFIVDARSVLAGKGAGLATAEKRTCHGLDLLLCTGSALWAITTVGTVTAVATVGTIPKTAAFGAFLLAHHH